jgi:hypothetical protein
MVRFLIWIDQNIFAFIGSNKIPTKAIEVHSSSCRNLLE